MRNPPEFAPGEVVAGCLQLVRLPEVSYVRQRERRLQKMRQDPEALARSCGSCVNLAAALYVRGGALERFRRACRLRRFCDRHGIRSERDLARWCWRAGRRIQEGRERGFSMRGAGGRRREFKEWLRESAAELEVEVPERRSGGRPGLLETPYPGEVDLVAALDVLERWLGHLRKRRRQAGETAPEHVRRYVTGETSFVEDRDPDAGVLEWELRRLAQEAAREVEDLEDPGEPRPTVQAAARRLLAGLSGGLLTPRQVADLAR